MKCFSFKTLLWYLKKIFEASSFCGFYWWFFFFFLNPNKKYQHIYYKNTDRSPINPCEQDCQPLPCFLSSCLKPCPSIKIPMLLSHVSKSVHLNLLASRALFLLSLPLSLSKRDIFLLYPFANLRARPLPSNLSTLARILSSSTEKFQILQIFESPFLFHFPPHSLE